MTKGTIAGWYGRIPRIEIAGEPRDRGLQYGYAARDLIERAVAIYEEWFASFAGVPWSQALLSARRIGAYIARHSPDLFAEMQGIAEGSGLSEETILALNGRTEIAYGRGMARKLAGGDREGCTAWAVLPEHTRGAGIICGQNWDWLAACMEIRVALDIALPGGLRLLTFCEAGQVGKVGFNSAGLVSCLNLLATVADRDAGLPVHALCRMVLEQSRLSDAARVIASHPRAASGNLLVARGLRDGTGEAMDFEFSPLTWAALEPVDGLLVHTNHFLSDPGATDQALIREGSKSTFVRQMRAARLIRAATAGGEGAKAMQAGATVAALQAIHADHFDHPYSICNHVSGNPGEAGQTNLAFLAAPASGEFWLSDGPPCGEGREGPAWQSYPMPWADQLGRAAGCKQRPCLSLPQWPAQPGGA